MSEQHGAFLVVEKGEPYRAGEVIRLTKERTVFGRGWGGEQVDIRFESMYISRRHAQIEGDGGLFVIVDLPESRNGVKINGEPLVKNRPYQIQHGDRIDLGGAVSMRFESHLASGETWSITSAFSKERLVVRETRREVFVEGRKMPLPPKEFDLLALLWANRGQLVSDTVIKRRVWPERRADDENLPLVDDGEVTQVAFRLRRALGAYGHLIQRRRAFGYLLEDG